MCESNELNNCPQFLFKINTYYIIIDIVCTQISERFNDKSSPLYKDLSLFHVKRLQEVSEQSNLPTDAFEGFEKVYGKYVTAEDLKREYKLFADSYFMFEKLMKFPEKIHENETIVSDESDNDTERDEHEISMGDEKNLRFN